ncbi:MAG: hypothetical protein KJ896_02240, partial [Nanoarchaeota archaeon]|nr:hypothetical protein [Nanoarchaeota archaeon]
MKDFFRNYLDYEIKRIRVREKYFSIQISSVILIHVFGNIIDLILEVDYKNNPNLRKAFLRGLFASEGGIGIQST